MRLLRRLLILVILVACACGVFGFWIARDLRTPRQHAAAAVYIEIPRGSTPAEMLARLKSKGVIGREWTLLLYVRLRGLGPKLKAGEYRFPSPITPLQVLRKLEEGEERLDRFTVIEGWTRFDIANAMARIPELKVADADEALRLMDDTTLIRDLDPRADNLEGYLFPDTYN
ncbi:MAG: endolytic transglycosylase MltG, partial [Acidobacteria bacterium]|nr:endolytic transglycosylase MltG [Acidobacteriota bacterium]